LPDQQDLLFGQVAVQAGFVTEAQLHEALRKQARDAANGIDRRIGEILIELGHLSSEQARSVLRRQQTRTGEHKMVGKYEILAKLGEGGMGSVYLARDVENNTRVALKVLPPKLAENHDYLMRFHREAKSVLALHHENIAAGIDVGFEDGYHYFAMEYIDGPTLYDLLRQEKTMPEPQALAVALQISQALEHAARREIVHRDIKPENIMLHNEQTAKLVDLGLARSYHDESVRLTQSGMAIGTPHYISPEQARGEHDVDTRSDIYSLGATIYHAVTGRVPFDGATAAVIMTKHLNEQLPWPSDVNPEVSEATSILISRMLAKEPADRYQNPAELSDDIRKVLRGESPSRQLLPVGRSHISSKRIKEAAKKAARLRQERRQRRLEETGSHKPIERPKTQTASSLAGLSESASKGAAVASDWFGRQPAGIQALIVSAAVIAFIVILVLIAMPPGPDPADAPPTPPKVQTGEPGDVPPPPGADNPEALAASALADANEYAAANPGATRDICRHYDDVCARYPGTTAAKTAYDRLMQITREIRSTQKEPGPEATPPTGTPEPSPREPRPEPQPVPPVRETVVQLIGDGLAGWKAYGDWSRVGEAIWFSYDAARPLSRSLVSGASFGDIRLTGEFRAEGAGTLTFVLRETDDGLLWVDLTGAQVADLGGGWLPFEFTARGDEATFSAAGRNFPVKRRGKPDHGEIRFTLVAGSLGLRRLRARISAEAAPDRLLVFGSDFEAEKSKLWARGRRVRRITYKGSLGALSGEDIDSRNFSSVVILSEKELGLFRASADMRFRFAAYLRHATFFEVRIYVKDVHGYFRYRPANITDNGTWGAVEFGLGDLEHSTGRPLKVGPGDEIIVFSAIAGKPPERTQLVIDAFEVTVKR